MRNQAVNGHVCVWGYHHRDLHEVTESKFKAQKTKINATNDPRKKKIELHQGV